MQYCAEELATLSKEARRLTLKCIASLGKGHVGGSIGIVDVLVAMYFNHMNIDSNNPNMKGRDRLVMSKGHAGPALYAVLSMKGFFPEEKLFTLNQPGTMLPSHCDRLLTPGIDMTTGSLGQGLSAAIGMALSDRIDNNNAYVYCIIGDGESQEGQIWEAGMYAAQMKLGSLICFHDVNNFQIDGPVNEINSLRNVADKWNAFGWNVQEIDGNDIQSICDAIYKAKECKDKPNMIVAHTIKGKGWKRIENTTGSHSRAISKEDLDEALGDLQ